jgi:RimJ/RimL family protein N-acetyltransferase
MISDLQNYTPRPHPKGLTLTGTEVTLRPLSCGDHTADLFWAFGHDVDGKNWAYLPYGPFDSESALGDWIRTQEGLDDPVFFAICRNSDGRAIGVASYLRINPTDGVIEVGHIHFSPLLQRSRAATETMYLMMQWAFNAGYRRYEWKCNARNMPSRRAAQRLGLSYEGIFRQAGIVKGENRDTAWFAAIDAEWAALQTCFERYLAPDNFDTDGRAQQALGAMTAPILHLTDPAFD